MDFKARKFCTCQLHAHITPSPSSWRCLTSGKLNVHSPGTLLPCRMPWVLHPTMVRHSDVNATEHPKAFSAEPLGRCCWVKQGWWRSYSITEKREAPRVSKGQVKGCVGEDCHGRIHGCCFQSLPITKEEVGGTVLLKAGSPSEVPMKLQHVQCVCQAHSQGSCSWVPKRDCLDQGAAPRRMLFAQQCPQLLPPLPGSFLPP